ncbi:MAG TPA: hypothetical protein VJI33_04435 [Candidatus Paceibacterota bacterium]
MNEQYKVSDGGKKILNTVKDELFPILNQLKDLLVSIQKCRINFSIYSKELSDLELKYSDLATSFFTVTKKLKTPDILFSGLDDNPQNIADYFQFQDAFSLSIEEGTKYVEIIDRTLDRKSQNIQNFRTIILAFTAIVISIISIIWK